MSNGVELKTYNQKEGSRDNLAGSYNDKQGVDNPAFGSEDSIIKSESLTSPRNVTVNIGNGHTKPAKHEEDGDLVPHEDAEWEDPNSCQKAIMTMQTSLSDSYKRGHQIIWWCIYAIILALYVAYFIYAMYYKFGDEGSIRLLAVNCVAVFCIIYYLIKRFYGRKIWKGCMKPIYEILAARWHILQWVMYAIFFVGLVLVLIFLVALKKPTNLISLIGLAVYILLFYLCSHNPARVQWRPVIWGLCLQFVFALLILKTDWGFLAFQWLGDRVGEFLEHTDAGSSFVFGDKFVDHFFAFKVLPVVVFFSTAISILYYLGWMQIVIEKVAWIMQVTMGTTAAESLNAAGNIFIGQSEAPLMIRPFIRDMTNSELHAVMTGGYATIAGSVLAAYILFGVPANHLLSASVMSAPAALAMSKLFYPETKKSRTTVKDVQHMQKSPAKNVIEAASEGASASIKLVANIAANLIAFLAILAFINATLKWLGHRVGLIPPDYPELTFELICSYLLYPFAWIMGTEPDDCGKMGTLIGIKTFLNEFVAYSRLGVWIENKKNFTAYEALYPNDTSAFQYIQDDIFLVYKNETLVGGFLSSARSEVIATYALCGFANLSSIGIMLGALGVMAPQRKPDLAKIVVRAMIAGNVACFMTACIAGLLTTD